MSLCVYILFSIYSFIVISHFHFVLLRNKLKPSSHHRKTIMLVKATVVLSLSAENKTPSQAVGKGLDCKC